MTQMRVKSTLFRAFDTTLRRNEDFTRDLKQLTAVWANKAKEEVFREKLPGVLLTRTNLEEREATEDLANALSQLVTDTSYAVDCVSFFLDHLSSTRGRGDQPSDMAHDVVLLKLVDEREESDLQALLKWLKDDLLPTVEPELRSRGAASGLFPSLKGISIDVGLRAVQLDKYDSRTNVEDYRPTITGLVGVASVELRTTGEDFVFQADKAELGLMIAHLAAAVKDLETLESYPKRKKA